MNRIIFSILACFSFLWSNAQIPDPAMESPGDYFNNFQKFTNQSPNADAAFYNIRKLASNPVYASMATELIHNSFAQDFIDRQEQDEADLAIGAKRRLLATQILAKMYNDPSALVRRHVQPLFILVKVQEARDNPDRLSTLAREFITTEIDGQDIYQDRAGRYGLMILAILGKYPELKSISEQLGDKVSAKLIAGQVVVTDSSSRTDLARRAWYRFLSAYLNFSRSEQALDQKEKGNFLKAAFEFSPDLVDRNHKPAYFYDMHFLLGKEKEGFQDDYLQFITAASDKQQVMATLLKMALVQPSFKENLRIVHQEVMPGSNFNAYWRKSIDAEAVTAPPISLGILGKTLFSSKSHSGEWILIDFWGTWCRPCREEHPALQKFFETTVAEKSKKLSVLTVACRDTEARVTEYMRKGNYNFPVAMADNRIEKSFKVQGYPTKILITPEGKYVTIPFGVDWVGFLNKYVETN